MEPPHYLGTAPLYPLSQYVRELRAGLPREAFEPARSRALLIPLHLGLVTAETLVIARGWVPWFVVPLISLAIGISFACLTFVAHEALHGGIARGKRAKHAIGWLGFLPFVLSPRLWVAWHDRVHHANANLPDDPDMYPTLERYRAHQQIRLFVDWFSLGCRRWRGGLSLVLGFTVQSLHQLIAATSSGFLAARDRRLAMVETALAIGVWAVLAALVGFVPFLFVFVLPLVVANIIVMAFILTNHSLSPLVPINDPLISGLSVTSSPIVERLTLRFGYHVEHHLFPAMSSRHADKVRDLLRVHWPERYQSMPLTHAIRELHRTARVYKDATTLIDPRTGAEFSTLLPATTAA
ncbi:MAG: fatty acid desaturase [Deltaproteobacteria bacterium]|nr:fatty acid desaturase [Deltaproteobacteria bacterium]